MKNTQALRLGICCAPSHSPLPTEKDKVKLCSRLRNANVGEASRSAETKIPIKTL